MTAKSIDASVDHEHMLSDAVQFFLGAERCIQKIKFADYPNHSLATVDIVLYAFALELCLKLKLHLDNKGEYAKGHDIFKLLKTLTKKSRKSICQHYTASQTTLGDIRAVLIVIKGTNIDEKRRGPFEIWRYACESRSTEIFTCTKSLRDLFIATHKSIRAEHPNLISSYEKDWGGLLFDSEWRPWVWEPPSDQTAEKRELDKDLYEKITRASKEELKSLQEDSN